MTKRIRRGAEPDPKAITRISVFGWMGQPEEIANMALFLASNDSLVRDGSAICSRWRMDHQLTTSRAENRVKFRDGITSRLTHAPSTWGKAHSLAAQMSLDDS
jgi:hypothetical protein